MNHLRFLRYVDEVARTGSVRQAAERLHVTPSAVLRRIQDLEDELGTPLFERLPRGMRLTAAGEMFVHYIRVRAADLQQVLSRIEEFRGLRRGTVRLVASQALASRFLPHAVTAFRKSHPLVTFDVLIGNHAHAIRALRSLEADIALAFNVEPEADITRMHVIEQKLVAIMHESHPLACHTGLRIRDCLNYPVVLPHDDAGGRQLLNRLLSRSSARPDTVIESNSFEFLRACLHYDSFVSFRFTLGATSGGDDGIVSRKLEDRGAPRSEMVLAALRGRQLPVIAHAFAEHVKQCLAELRPPT
ncbi:LysR family transcriptional regulator [Paraburkholderia xenovorans]|uniref:LysR family transcriptional regulator n=1 Tax=Paraburkholderia xenovorans TaxID=36873 RepID=UPI0015594B64|nr:LysR family transcriptional regulator [Paraburkholderia xenovorans]NPT37482.1 LysR family transcriptional regulator [Paraburkholderia xenovorans]